MTLHTLNVKGLEQPHRQPQRQTTPRQTTRKGRTGGTDGRQFSLTPTVKAAPFAALGTGPVTICAGRTVAQSAVDGATAATQKLGAGLTHLCQMPLGIGGSHARRCPIPACKVQSQSPSVCHTSPPDANASGGQRASKAPCSLTKEDIAPYRRTAAMGHRHRPGACPCRA